MTERIIHGDCLDVMRELEPDSIDAIVTDPPYGIGFMGKQWDRFDSDAVEASWSTRGRKNEATRDQDASTPHGRSTTGVGFRKPNPRCGLCGRAINGRDTAKGFKVCHCPEPQPMPSVNRDAHRFQEFMTEWAAECWRVAKPGTYLLAFGGTRTYHRMACAIEDAGWEIHDCLTWLYGSGFPKHKSKLKPAWEPIVMARKPAPKATALNIDACRIGTDTVGWGGGAFGAATWQTGLTKGGEARPVSGRWPANVLIDEEAADAIDAQSGERAGMQVGTLRRGATTGRSIGGNAYGTADPQEVVTGYGDTGGASRFYYCAKASRSEREAGLDGVERKRGGSLSHTQSSIGMKDGRDAPRGNHHPTVKPVALMRWLVRLVTPPGGTVLDPFAGSGTTGIAAVLEDRSFIGIDNDDEYVPITAARVAHHAAQGSLFRPVE